jgi:hypothetical protein
MTLLCFFCSMTARSARFLRRHQQRRRSRVPHLGFESALQVSFFPTLSQGFVSQLRVPVATTSRASSPGTWRVPTHQPFNTPAQALQDSRHAARSDPMRATAAVHAAPASLDVEMAALAHVFVGAGSHAQRTPGGGGGGGMRCLLLLGVVPWILCKKS